MPSGVPMLPLSFDLQQLANIIGAKLVGDKSFLIAGLASLESASNDQLAFYANKHYKKCLATTNAGCVLMHSAEKDAFVGNKLLCDDPYLAYAQLTRVFVRKPESEATSISTKATIAANVVLGDKVVIGPNVVVEDGASIGAGCRLFPGAYIGANTRIGSGSMICANVSIYANVDIGQDCILHSGSVIGSDGFGFAPSTEGWQKIYHLGGVSIGNQVEIGAGTTIDRGALDNTVIANGVKIDNQVQIAHNVSIGEYTAIAGAVAIAGSTKIGKRCRIAGAVGIIGHLTIVDDVTVTAMSLVTKSINRAGSYSSGVPLNETRQWRKNAARFNRLDALVRQLTSIRK